LPPGFFLSPSQATDAGPHALESLILSACLLYDAAASSTSVNFKSLLIIRLEDVMVIKPWYVKKPIKVWYVKKTVGASRNQNKSYFRTA
jgi:hypothetical protein